MESRTQGWRPRTQKKSGTKAKDSPSENRPFRGLGQECSSPKPRTKDTGASAPQKKSSKIFFRRSPKKQKKRSLKISFRQSSNEENKKALRKTFRKVFGVFQQNFNGLKNSAVFEQRTGQFSRTWGFEAKTKDFKMCPRGQGRRW